MSEQEKNQLDENGQTSESSPKGETKPAVKKDDKIVQKDDKVAKKANKKPGFFSRVAKWFRELKAEAKKVIWPTRKQTVNNTIVVIVVAVVVCIFVAILDTTFSFVRDFIARLVV